MSKSLIYLIAIIAVLAGAWYLIFKSNLIAPTAPAGERAKKNGQTEKMKNITVKISTNFGTIKIRLYGDYAPKTVANFVKLAKEGFYDGTRFHRVIKGFMIQGGDPLSKDISAQNRWGTGGPGYKFADEINPNAEPYVTGYKRGIVAMANSGPDTNGSQFFIMHKDYPLPPNYTIFGQVTEGMDAVDKIADNPTGANDRPIKDVIIEKVEMTEE